MKNRPNYKIYKRIKYLFPIEYKKNLLPKFLESFFKILDKKTKKDYSRISGKYGKEVYGELIKKYSVLPTKCGDPIKKCNEIVNDLFSGLPRWRSQNLQYNVGAAVNTAASAVYALALDENIYNINDGLAGNALVAEQAVTKILSNLANIKTKSQGLFTFGGTATNFYAIKVGIKKAAVYSGKRGMPKNIKILVTQDAHFSHTVSADWLGIGTDNVVVIKANPDRTSNLKDAEKKIKQILRRGYLLSTIIINGGTTYNHTIDDIKSFVKLRDRMAKKFSLSYKPHLHVDTVIGWAWLMFKNYDFKKNNLKLDKEILTKIKKQYYKLKYLKYADSWSADFHKGVGACPIPCSIIIFNNMADLNFLSKKEGSFIDMHQLAPEFSFTSPADFTLETSRPGGAPLAALASLHTLGIDGYRRNLANLVRLSLLTKKMLDSYNDVIVYNKNSLGYVTMFGFCPPGFKKIKSNYLIFLENNKKVKEMIKIINKYTKDFFTWDYKNRISQNRGVEYSFTSEYIKLSNDLKISAAKLYPVSPHIDEFDIEKAVKTIIEQKRKFDNEVWRN